MQLLIRNDIGNLLQFRSQSNTQCKLSIITATHIRGDTNTSGQNIM